MKDHLTLKTGVMINSAWHNRNELDFEIYLIENSYCKL